VLMRETAVFPLPVYNLTSKKVLKNWLLTTTRAPCMF